MYLLAFENEFTSIVESNHMKISPQHLVKFDSVIVHSIPSVAMTVHNNILSVIYDCVRVRLLFVSVICSYLGII